MDAGDIRDLVVKLYNICCDCLACVIYLMCWKYLCEWVFLYYSIFSLCRLSPEVFLKRPATGTHWRLDKILKRKAVWGKTLLHYINILYIQLIISHIHLKKHSIQTINCNYIQLFIVLIILMAMNFNMTLCVWCLGTGREGVCVVV